MAGAVWMQQDPGIAYTSLNTAGGTAAICDGDTEHLDAFPSVGLHHRHYKE